MTPTAKILLGNCIERMKEIESESIHAVVCDPPYGISFMDKDFDKPKHMVGQSTGVSGGFQRIPAGVQRPDMSKCDGELFSQWCEAWATEALRVLKPGGHLLSFGATRMYHWMAVGIERAGFEVRDSLMWLYGSGFPKSHNTALGIDKHLGHGNRGKAIPTASSYQAHDTEQTDKLTSNPVGPYEPKTPEAAEWDGWGSALKPGYEPIVMARKPMTMPGKREGSVKKANMAQNVLEHGVGPINIDGCRISDAGRWPANLMLDEDSALIIDDEVGILKSGSAPNGLKRNSDKTRSVYGSFSGQDEPNARIYGDSGGPSRFFYVAKTSKAERRAGVPDELPNHPTQKPIDLMRYISRLVTPAGGTILDPFMGSGSTGCAAMLEGFDFIGIEMDEEYVQIAAARIKHWKNEANKESKS